MRQAVIPVKISVIAAKCLYILLQNAADDTNVKLTADQKMTKKCQFFIKRDFLTLFRQFLLKQKFNNEPVQSENSIIGSIFLT